MKTYEEIALELTDGKYQRFIDTKAEEEAEETLKNAGKEEKNVGKKEKDIISVKWVDNGNTKKEINQTLSNKWVSVKIETKGFQRGDKIKIKIEEINGKIFETERTKTKEKDDTLIIKNAFKFEKDKKNPNNTNRVVKITAYYEGKNVEGKNVLKENNGGIWGISADDAKKMKDDIHRVLANNKFSDVRALIVTEGKTLKKINNDELAPILAKIQDPNEATYINMVVNTINSEKIFKVEYVTEGSNISSEGAKLFIKEQIKKWGEETAKTLFKDDNVHASWIKNEGGDGLSILTEENLHFFIMRGLEPKKRAVIFGHEVFGHGIPAARGIFGDENNANAVRTDNLIRRILGMPRWDGRGHAGYGNLGDPYQLPITK
ncbi:MAG: hypothetical protein LBH22_09150 [Bacteroidales bacterium]|jgi:hypothetical protein|nr:hypothetical protein [Bacteroidales bacterium]